jgi:hypothetical protein
MEIISRGFAVTAPTLPALKALFAKSRNLCAFPGCAAPVVEESGTVTAEICHIRALNTGGPRYDKSQSPEKRNAASNLILMCGRHHKIIDTETRKYTADVLLAMKLQHEERGVTEISPQVTRVAEQLLANYARISVVNNKGNIAIHSPGAVQANTINFTTTRQKVSVAPPAGTIGASASMSSYCSYLIDRYQQYQKGDPTGKTDFKYQAIHLALKRRFKGPWKLLDEEFFTNLAAFLQARIDATFIGRLNRSKGIRNYHQFDEAPRKPGKS